MKFQFPKIPTAAFLAMAIFNVIGAGALEFGGDLTPRALNSQLFYGITAVVFFSTWVVLRELRREGAEK